MGEIVSRRWMEKGTKESDQKTRFVKKRSSRTSGKNLYRGSTRYTGKRRLKSEKVENTPGKRIKKKERGGGGGGVIKRYSREPDRKSRSFSGQKGGEHTSNKKKRF